MQCWTRLGLGLLLSLSNLCSATELTASVFVSAGSAWSKPFEQWVEKINASADLTIRLIGPEALPPSEQVQAFKERRVEIIVLPAGNYLTWMPEAAAQDLSNMTLAEQRASGGYAALNQLLRKRLNAIALTTYGTGVTYHLYLTEPISSSKALQGMRVRTHAMHSPFFQSLGLYAATIDPTNLATALDYNIVQGYGTTLWGTEQFAWAARTVQRVEPGFYNASVNVLMHYQTWQALSEAQQQALTKASYAFEKNLPAYTAKHNQQARLLQQQAGIQTLNLGPNFAAHAEQVYWQQLEQKSPKEIAKLKPLLIKPVP